MLGIRRQQIRPHMSELVVLLLQIRLIKPADASSDQQHAEPTDQRLHAALATHCGSALTLGAAEDFVGRHAEKPGQHLGKREILAVTLLSGVGREQVCRLAGYLPLGVELELQRWRDALTLGVARLAAHDQRITGRSGWRDLKRRISSPT